MSLLELLIAAAISTIIVLGAGSILVFVADAFGKIVDKDEAETSMTRAGYYLRTIATQALNLNVVAVDGNIEGIGDAGSAATASLTSGQILNAADSRILDPSGTAADRGRLIELAVFHREGSITGNSRFWPTGIFFKTPWNTCPPNAAALAVANSNTREKCSGQLIIITNNFATDAQQRISGVFDAAANQLYQYPTTYNAEVFDRFTSLVLTTTSVGGGANYARDARFRLTVRYFLTGSPLNYNYIPSDGVNPPTTFGFKDLSMEVYVGFRNNFLGRSQLVIDEAERLHGSLYYFPFISPLRGL